MVIGFGELNGLAVAAGTVASFVLGGLWFAGLFAKVYKRALGRETEPTVKPAPIYLIGPFVCGLVTTITSAILMNLLQISTMESAVAFGALVGVGYLAATTVNTGINPNIPRPLLYGVVSGCYFILSNLVVTAILFALG